MSTINDTDIVLINRGGDSYQMPISSADNLQDADLLLVNRGNISYKCTWLDALDKIEDTDILLINRGGVSYKVTGADFKGSFTCSTGLITVYTPISGTTAVLTFGSSTGFDCITDGAAIKQNTPLTPVTSQITNVQNTEIQYYIWDAIYVDERAVFPTTLEEVRQQGQLVAPNASGEVPYTGSAMCIVYVMNGARGLVGTAPWTLNAGNIGFTVVDQYSATNVPIGPKGGAYNSNEYYLFSWANPPIAAPGFYYLNTDAAWFILNNRNLEESGWYPVLEPDSVDHSTALTFQDDTQLNNFQPGDVISEPATVSLIQAPFQTSVAENLAPGGSPLTYETRIGGDNNAPANPTLSNAAANTFGITKMLNLGGTIWCSYVPTVNLGYEYSYDLVFYWDGNPVGTSSNRRIIGWAGSTNGGDVFIGTGNDGYPYIGLKGGLINLPSMGPNPGWWHLRLCNQGQIYFNGVDQGPGAAASQGTQFNQLNQLGYIGSNTGSADNCMTDTV